MAKFFHALIVATYGTPGTKRSNPEMPWVASSWRDETVRSTLSSGVLPDVLQASGRLSTTFFERRYWAPVTANKCAATIRFTIVEPIGR
jgi:hypothetical protein